MMEGAALQKLYPDSAYVADRGRRGLGAGFSWKFSWADKPGETFSGPCLFQSMDFGWAFPMCQAQCWQGEHAVPVPQRFIYIGGWRCMVALPLPVCMTWLSHLTLLTFSFLIDKMASQNDFTCPLSCDEGPLSHLSTDYLGLTLRNTNKYLPPISSFFKDLVSHLGNNVLYSWGCGEVSSSGLWKASTMTWARSSCLISDNPLDFKSFLWPRGLIWHGEVREVFCWTLKFPPFPGHFMI